MTHPSTMAMQRPFPSNPPVMFVGAPAFPPPTIIQSNLSTKHTSCGMIFFGISLILLSTGSIGMSAYIIIKIETVPVVLASICSGTFFFITGILAIYGGSSVWERKGTIIVSSIFGIVGIIAALVAIGFASAAIQSDDKDRRSCIKCHGHLIKKNLDVNNPFKALNIISEEADGACDFMCSNDPYIILACLAVVEGLSGLLLSYVSCCNCCSCCCCYKAPPTNVVPIPMAFTKPPDKEDYHLQT